MTTEQVYAIGMALVNAVIVLACLRIREPRSVGAVQLLRWAFAAMAVSWALFLVPSQPLFFAVGFFASAAYLWLMAAFAFRRSGRPIPWVWILLVYAAHASITAFFAVQGNVPAGLHATTVFASLALLPVAYLFLAVKPNRTVSDIAFAAAHLALVIVAAVRTVLLLVAPQWLEGSIMVSQVLWPGVFTASGIFAITGYMEEAQAELLRKALRDPLTSLLNRRGFGEAIERALTKARAKGQNWALIFVDIDHFKSINDRFGHDTGDSVIQAVAKALREELRAGEELARYGGEEFLLFVPVDDEDALSARAERLRQAVSRLAVGPDEERLSASLGVARRSVDASFESVFKLADETLHRAKANGRDRVEYAVDELAGSQPA